MGGHHHARPAHVTTQRGTRKRAHEERPRVNFGAQPAGQHGAERTVDGNMTYSNSLISTRRGEWRASGGASSSLTASQLRAVDYGVWWALLPGENCVLFRQSAMPRSRSPSADRTRDRSRDRKKSSKHHKKESKHDKKSHREHKPHSSRHGEKKPAGVEKAAPTGVVPAVLLTEDDFYLRNVEFRVWLRRERCVLSPFPFPLVAGII
jgi:hypothetical protein